MNRAACLSVTLGFVFSAGAAFAQAPADNAPAPDNAPPPAAAPPPGPPPAYPPPGPAPAYPAPQERAEEETRDARNSFYGELGGPGLVWSVNYDRYLTDDISARIGFGYLSFTAYAATSTQAVAETASVFFIPITMSYTGIGSKRHMLELGGGASIVHASAAVNTLAASASDSATTAFGTVLIGYRFQPPGGGFQFRAGLSPIIYSGFDDADPTQRMLKVLPWGYVSFGGAF